MKIIQTAEGIALKVNKDELINIYSSLLLSLVTNRKYHEMQITRELVKNIADYYKKPF